jgi:hypothetical protein
MSRVLLFVFAVMQAQVVVALAIAPSTICPERCPDDGPDGRCPPVCLTCPLSSHPATPLPARVASVPVVRWEALPRRATVPVTEPEPDRIFHVPKPLLA